MKPESLRRDDCYFLVTYHDEALRIPTIATYIYVGRDIFGGGSSRDARWFFQSGESRNADGLFDPKVHEPGENLLCAGQDMVEEFCDFEELIGVLREIEGRSSRSI